MAIVNRTPTPAADPAMAMFRDERRLESFQDGALADGDALDAFGLLRRSYDAMILVTAVIEEITSGKVELLTKPTVRVAMASVARPSPSR